MLSEADTLGPSGSMPKQLVIRQIVVQNHIGALQALNASDGDQARMSWPRPNEIDFSSGQGFLSSCFVSSRPLTANARGTVQACSLLLQAAGQLCEPSGDKIG